MTAERTEPTPEDLQATYDTFSPELKEYIDERIDKATLNWLCIYGVPEKPVEVRSLIHVIYRGVASLLLVEGFATLTEKGAGSEEDVEKAKADREREQREAAQGLSQLFDPANFDKQFQTGAGGYL